MGTQIDYRYPTENNLLAVTVLAAVLGLALFSTFSVGMFLVLFLIGFGINYLLIRAKIEGLKRSAVRVTAAQFPEIQALVDDCAARVRVPADTEIFISYSPVMNAYAMGFGQPFSIVLHSALVEALDPQELKSVIGHEMGHIHFGHTVLLTIIGQLGSQAFGIPLVGLLVRYIFLFWSRAAELTADRAGLVACGRLEKAVSTEVKLGIGPELARKVNFSEVVRQANESRGNWLGAFGEMLGTHPMMVTRIQKMAEFAASPVFHQLRPDAPPVTSAPAVSPAPAASTRPRSAPPGDLACPQCGKPWQPEWKFCLHCGTRLRG